MVEVQLSAVYRRKAAELRAAAARIINNISIQYEFLKVADAYDDLAETAERYARGLR
jgi:hypothetical protein